MSAEAARATPGPVKARRPNEPARAAVSSSGLFDALKVHDAIREAPWPRAWKAVLNALTSRCDRYGQCFPSYGRIAKDSKYSRRYVIAIADKLVEERLILREARHDGAGDTSSNLYTVLVKPVHHPVNSVHHGSEASSPRVVKPVHRGGVTSTPEGSQLTSPTEGPHGRESYPRTLDRNEPIPEGADEVADEVTKVTGESFSEADWKRFVAHDAGRQVPTVFRDRDQVLAKFQKWLLDQFSYNNRPRRPS